MAISGNLQYSGFKSSIQLFKLLILRYSYRALFKLITLLANFYENKKIAANGEFAKDSKI